MQTLHELVSPLAAEHRQALLWFHSHEGMEVDWPAPLPNGVFLVNRAKGIHKPSGWRYALSVRQVLSGPYADLEPAKRADGSWTYKYFQEGQDPADRDRYFTNRALIACQNDVIPVGVLRQTRGKPNVKYNVLGLALVRDWQDGYFTFEGIVDSSSTTPVISVDVNNSNFDPLSYEDARRRIIAAIVLRQGQGPFRTRLLEAYARRCAITDYDVVETLEAAHIIPFKGEHTNVPTNGLLLRADLHTLFDLGLITVDTQDFSIVLSPKLHGTVYGELACRRLRLPQDVAARPSVAALNEHRRWSAI